MTLVGARELATWRADHAGRSETPIRSDDSMRVDSPTDCVSDISHTNLWGCLSASTPARAAERLAAPAGAWFRLCAE